jgi:hypothetical protein
MAGRPCAVNIETIPASVQIAEEATITERTAKRRAKASLDADEDDEENHKNKDKNHEDKPTKHK